MKRLIGLLSVLVYGVSLLLFSAGSMAASSIQGEIAYIHDDHVWISNADGTGQTQLTSDDAVYSAPALSPDSSLIAVERKAPGGRSRIFIVPVNGSSSYQLSELYTDYLSFSSPEPYVGDQYRPKWSPDGTHVTFYSEEFAQPGGDPYRVFMSEVGGIGREIGNGLNPEYSPDGGSIGYMVYQPVGETYYWRLRVFDVASLQIQEVYRTQNVIMSFSWSPDNVRIAIVSQVSDSPLTQLIFVNPFIDQSLQIPNVFSSQDYRLLGDVSWSPSGDYLALIGESNLPVNEVLIFDMTNLEFRPVTNTQDESITYRFPLWDNTSRQLLVSYSAHIEAPYRLALVDVQNEGSVTLLQQMMHMLPGDSRDLKDWNATIFFHESEQQTPPTSTPQVLGTSTDDLPPSRNAPTVLGAATLPATGFGPQASHNSLLIALLFVVIGALLFMYDRKTAKK